MALRLGLEKYNGSIHKALSNTDVTGDVCWQGRGVKMAKKWGHLLCTNPFVNEPINMIARGIILYMAAATRSQ